MLSVFTNRVKKIEITDQKGRKHRITSEQQTENVCSHSQLKRIGPLQSPLWKCIDTKVEKDCPTYFFITHQYMLTADNLYGWMDAIADHMGEKLIDVEKQAE